MGTLIEGAVVENDPLTRDSKDDSVYGDLVENSIREALSLFGVSFINIGALVVPLVGTAGVTIQTLLVDPEINDFSLTSLCLSLFSQQFIPATGLLQLQK